MLFNVHAMDDCSKYASLALRVRRDASIVCTVQRWLSKVLASVRLAADQSARLAWHQSLFFEALDSQYTHCCRVFNGVFCYTIALNTNISTRALVVALKSPFSSKSTT